MSKHYLWFIKPAFIANGLYISSDQPVFGIDKNDHQNDFQAAIAQLGERQTEDLKVPGSIPGRGIDFST